MPSAAPPRCPAHRSRMLPVLDGSGDLACCYGCMRKPGEKRATRPARGPSALERLFALDWDGPPYVAGYHPFPGRKIHLDAAWPDARVGVEIQGGCHRATEERQRADAEKRNLLVQAGWRVYEATASMLQDPARAIAFRATVNEALQAVGAERGEEWVSTTP